MRNLILKSGLVFIFFNTLFLNAIEIGDSVPIFEAIDSKGKKWSSNQFKNKKGILLFFYPAAMTGGCTKQACAYRDDLDIWKKKNFEVIGISGDQVENLSLFAKSEKIPFTLLADPMGKVAKLFNVPTSKGGRIERFVNGDRYTLERGITTKRWTFLISKNGKLLFKNERVNAAMDSAHVLKFVEENK